MKKKGKYYSIKSLLAGIMAMVLLLQVPLGYVVQAEDTVTQEDAGEIVQDQEVPEEIMQDSEAPPAEEPEQAIPEEVVRESRDWTDMTDAVKFSLEKISVGESVILPSEDQEKVYDLSTADREKIMQFEAGIEFLGVPQGEELLAGDTVTLSIPEEQWKLQDVTEPLPLYTVDKGEYQTAGMNAAKGNEIGTYLISENKLKITFNESVQEHSTFFSVISFTGNLLDTTQEPEITILLQPDNQVKVILPKSVEEVKSEEQEKTEEVKNEQTPPAEEVKNEEVKEEVPEEVKKEDPEEVKKEDPEEAKEEVPGEIKDEIKDTVKDETVSEDKENAQVPEEEQPKQEVQSSEEPEKNEEKTGIREKLGSLFQNAAKAFKSETNEVPKEYYKNAVKSKHTFTGADLSDGFDNVKLTVQSREDGYKKDDTDAYVNMAYSVYMDEDFLYNKSEEFMRLTSFPQQGSLSDEEWFVKVKKWLDNQDEATVPPLVYSYDLGELFSKYSQETKVLYNGGDNTEEIGEYVIENGVLKVTMNNLLYFRNNITFSFNFDAELDTSRLSDDPQEIVVGDDGKLIHQSKGTAGGGTGETGKPDYVIDKEAPVRVSDSTITYHLTVSAMDQKYLNGKILNDAMPQVTYEGKDYKLKVVSLSKKGDSGDFDTPVKYELDAAGGISYQFEALNKDQSNAVKEAEFELVLELDEDSYQNMIKQGNVKLSFTNQAALKEEGASDPIAVSESVPTKMKMSFIGKQGKEANLEGTRYAWTIDLKTKLPSMKEGYGFLVDTICETDHTYDMEHGVEVTADGSKAEVLHPERKEVNSPVKWEDLTADNLHNMMADNGITEPFYYVYDVTDKDGNPIANPFYGQKGNDTSQYVQRAVLVIPYDNYKGPNGDGTGRAVTMKYLTDLNSHGLDSKTYLDILSSHPEYTQEIKNQVNLLWENEGGVGPGPVPQDEVDFGKSVNTDIDAVHKNGASYNSATKMAEWAVDVNKLGISLENVVLTDELGTGIYDTGNINITYYRYYNGNHDADDSGTLTQLSGEPADAELNSAFGYTVDADGKLKIYLGDLSGDSASGYLFYKLSIQIPVIDEEILSSQSKDQNRSNEIKLSAVHVGTPYEGTSKADLTMPNTLIEKTAEGVYDYKTHKLSWSVTVNPEKVNIEDAVVTDTMEQGFTFGELTAVEKNGTADSNMYDQLKGHKASGQVIAWDMGNIGENAYTLHFTTEASEQWRNDNLLCPTDGNGELLTGTTIDVPNHAELAGMVNGTRQITGAKADAAQTIEKIPLSKKGTLNEDTGEIQWIVMANQDQYNLSGMYLTENLTSVHELDPDSVKVYSIDKDGNETKDGTGQLKDINMQGFTYTFPENGGNNYQTYKLTFSTYLTEEAEASDASISNQVYLKNNDGSYEEISEPDDGGFHGGFDFANAASASKRPKIALRKVSSNSIDSAGGGESLGLNALFSLKGYEYSYDSTTGELKVETGSPISKYDKTRMVAQGDASFLNINPNDNIIYVLTEEEALDGYEKMTAKPQFLYFPRSESTDISGSVNSVSYNGEDFKSEFNRIEPKDYKDGGVPKTVTVTNTPAAMEFEFTKLQVKQSSYENSQTNQTKEYEPSNEVIFKMEPQGNLEGKVKTRYIKSSSDGKLKIKDLDPGDYKLTEIHSDDNIVSGGTVMLQVGWSQGAGYAYTFSNPTGGIGIDDTAPSVLKDELLTGSFSFVKYVQYQDKADGTLAGKETLSGVEFYMEGKTKESPVQNFSTTATSDADGKVEFRDIPAGDYAVYENPVKGYEEYKGTGNPVQVYDVEVSDKPTDQELGEYEGKTYYAKKAEAEVTVTRTGTDSESEIHNTAIRGDIQLTKVLHEEVLKDLNGQVLEGARFGLFRRIGATTEASPVYQAVSDSVGSITFTQVEYGDYILKEIKAPEGYDNHQLGLEIAITRDILAGSFDNADYPGNFHYQIADSVENKLYKIQIPFVKKDSDSNAMEGIDFLLYRRNTGAIGQDGAGLTVSVAEAMHEYWAYKPTEKVTSGADGTFKLQGIPYGDYLMVENNEPADLQEDHSKEAIHISITEQKILITENENFEKTAESTVDGEVYKDVDPKTCGKWMEVQKEGSNYRIVNQRKYGYVQLYKTAGEVENGTITPDITSRLKGARLEITRGGSHYLTIETDESGRVVPITSGEHEGSYKDLESGSYRRLFYDDTYEIHEIKSPDGYKVNRTSVPFVISEDTTGHEGSAWVSVNGQVSNVIYTKTGETLPTVESSAVVNERQRGSFTLQKEDLEGNKKSEAVFGLYSGDKLIASLKETGAVDGNYHVVNKDFDGNDLDVKNDLQIPYLHFNGNEYAMLPGTYQVKENTAPKGYEVTTFTLNIAEKQDQSGVDVAVSGNDRASIGGNHIITLKDEPVEIKIRKTDLNGTELPNAEFTVTGKFADGTDGTKAFANVVSGQLIAGTSYTLKETKAPAGYIRSAESIDFTVGKDGTLTIADGKNTASVDNNQKDTIVFKDSPIDITLKKIDGFVKTSVIPGVTFTLKDQTDAGKEIGTFITETSGTVKLTGLTGDHTYQLKETAAPDGYVAGQEITFKVNEYGMLSDITEGVSTDAKKTILIVENKPVNASIRLKKVDSVDGSGIGDTSFTITKHGDTTGINYKTLTGAGKTEHLTADNIKETISLEKGELFITGLDKGSYTLKEVEANGNYELGAEPFTCTFTVSDAWGSGAILNINAANENKEPFGLVRSKGQWNEQGILNERKPGTVSLTKKGKPGQEEKFIPLKGAEFTLYDADKHEVKNAAGEAIKMETDEKGLAEITGLPWNKYYLHETKAPDGYAVDEQWLEFTIGYGVLAKGFSQVAGTSDIVNQATVFTLKKTDLKGNELTGAKFTMTGKFADTGNADEVRTYDMSSVSSHTVYRELIAGESYKITELEAPDGYEISKDITISVAKNGKISVNGVAAKDNVIQIPNEKIEVGLQKTGLKDVVLSGGTYTVKPAQGSAFAGSDQDPVTMTEATMKDQLSGKLMADNQYILKEETAPEGYELAKEVLFETDRYGKITLPENPDFAGVDSKDGKLPMIVLKDHPVELNLVKLDEKNEKLAGAVFTVTGTFAKFIGEENAPSEITVAQEESEQLTARLIAGNTYTVKETTEPDGYIKLAEAIMIKAASDGTFTIESNPENSAKLSETKDELRITDKQTKFFLDKISNETDTDGNIVCVKGAELEIRQEDGSPVKDRSWTSDGEHKGEITGLKRGKYQLAETKTPYGYVTALPIGFELHEDNTITLTGSEGEVQKDSEGYYTIVMTNTVIRSQARLTKIRTDLDGKTKTALEGAVFDLYRQNGDKPDSKQDTLIAGKLLTQADGTWTTAGNETVRVDNSSEKLAKGLTEGKYYFQETAAPKDTWLDPQNHIWAFSVTSDEHDNTVAIPAENKAFKANAVLKKVDQVSKEPLSGVEFTLFVKTSGDQWDVKDMKKTDADGNISFDLYEKGMYQIVETETVPGYQLMKEKAYTAEFTVDDTAYGKTLELKEEISAEEQDIFKPAIKNSMYAGGVIANERIPGVLQLSKADGEDQTNLDGVTFSLYLKTKDQYSKVGDFITGNRYVRETDDTWSQVPSEQGTLRIEGLDWGEYYIQESAAQSGYILSDEKYEFGIGRLGQEVVLSVDHGIIKNARTKLYFYKSGRVMEDCADGTLEGVPDANYNIPLAGSEFTAYTDKACKNGVTTVVSDNEGKVEFEKLPGDTVYYIRETKASEGYIQNDNLYKAKLNDHGEYVSFQSEDGSEIADLKVINDVKRTDIVLKKVSEQDPSKVIANSVYGLYKRTDQIPTERQILARAAANADTEQEEWTLIATAKTDKNGMLKFAGVLMNTDYMIRELQAPDGSHISSQPITIKFGVDESGKPIVAEDSNGGKTATIDPVTGEIVWMEPSIMLEFAKKNTQGQLLEGAKLKLVGEDGSTVDQWTSSGKETHVIYGDKMNGKIVGNKEYTLIEEQAPEGYLKADPVKFTIETKATGPNENFIQTIEMIDEKIPVKQDPPMDPPKQDPTNPGDPKADPSKPVGNGESPILPKDPSKITTDTADTKEAVKAKSVKTGDNDSMAAYIILMAGAVLAASGVIIRRKRKTK